MLNNILTTTVNPIPKDIIILNAMNTNLQMENTKLKKLLYIAIGAGVFVLINYIIINYADQEPN